MRQLCSPPLHCHRRQATGDLSWWGWRSTGALWSDDAGVKLVKVALLFAEAWPAAGEVGYTSRSVVVEAERTAVGRYGLCSVAVKAGQSAVGRYGLCSVEL